MQTAQRELSPITHVNRRATLQDTFEAFDEANPHVYFMLKRYALQIHRAGRKIGMKALFERLRWDYRVNTEHYDFKLNNNYTAFYARKLMADEPALRGFFETRRGPHD